MKLTVSVESADSVNESVVVAEINRPGPLNAASFGLTLAEAKKVLREIQRHLSQAQFAAHVEMQCLRRHCGSRRWTKDLRAVKFKSLFGSVQLSVPRLRGCRCSHALSGAKTVTVDGLLKWMAPELEYIQSRMAATLPYARSAELLSLLLPVDAGNSTSCLRRRTLAVGERLKAELRQSDGDALDAHECSNASTLAAMGLDGAYIRDCDPCPDRQFEVVVGRILHRNGRSRSLGFVRRVETNDQIRHRLSTRIAQEGASVDRLTVFTDGDANLRGLQLDVLPNARHLLDWYVRREVAQLFVTQEVTHDVTRCFATGSPPRRAGLATVRCGALGTMYPWPSGRSRRRKATATTGSIVRWGG